MRLFEWHKAIAILVTFDEDDFQKLVLNEDGDIHESLMSTSVGGSFIASWSSEQEAFEPKKEIIEESLEAQ